MGTLWHLFIWRLKKFPQAPIQYFRPLPPRIWGDKETAYTTFNEIDMKKCSKCNMEKELSDFRECNVCKTCYNRRVELWKKANGYNKKIMKSRTIINRKSQKKYAEKNMIKVTCRYICRQAVKKWELIKLPCEVCNSINRIEAHHEDYSKPLDVKWLCKKHHVELHFKK